MKKAIILVLTHEDAAKLAAAGKVVGRLGCSHLWVLLSPVLTIDPKAAVKQLDADIDALVAAEKQAAAVGDYITAKERKEAREKLMLERSVEIRNAWKRVPEDERKKIIGIHTANFMRSASPSAPPPAGWRVTMLAEHQESANWLPILNELRGAWHTGMVPGEFAVLWPQQLLELEEVTPIGIDYSKLPKPQPIQAVVPPKLPVSAIVVPKSRRAELEAMRHFALAAVAKKLGVAHDKRPKAEIIEDILKAEPTSTPSAV